jgi:hypothetical protein
MKIIDVQHKDIYAVAEFSLKQLKYLMMFLAKSKVEYNSEEEPEVAEAVEYVVEKLFPGLDEFIKDMERNYGS